MRALLRRIVGDFVTRDAGTRQGFGWQLEPRLADDRWAWSVVKDGRLVDAGIRADRKAARRAVDNVIWREAQP